MAAVPHKVPLALRAPLATMAHYMTKRAIRRKPCVLTRGVVVIKRANVKMRATPATGGKALATLGRNEELVVIGGEQSGYINVQGSETTGWVNKSLLTRQ